MIVHTAIIAYPFIEEALDGCLNRFTATKSTRVAE